jgi:hypothetical protein
MNVEERFWSKVDKTSDCWLWTAATDTAGYGQFRFEGKNTKAHRVSFFLTNQYWPVVCRHMCDNPPCVNPSHLLDGSHKDNLDDSYFRNRRVGLSSEQVEEIRAIPMSRTIIDDVVNKYGVSREIARAVLDGTSWGRLPGAREVVRQKSRSKLSVEDIVEIKRELAKDRYRGQINELAQRYGVTHSQISHIRRGYIHSDVSISGNINS